MTEQTREQKLINMVALTFADPSNVEDAEPGTEGHREPWEPWSAPVMVLAGYAVAQDSDGGLTPWLYLACRCGWWLGYGTQYDPAKFAEVTQAHGERCELNPAAEATMHATLEDPMEIGYPHEVPKPGEPQCQADGVRNGPDGPGGTEHYWTCTAPGTVEVDGELLCEDHAGELGHGPQQEDYGYDPDDGAAR